MKMFLLVTILSLSTLTVAETAPNHSAASASSGPVRTQISAEQIAAKLKQYVDACTVKRPSSDDEIRKLLQ